MNPAQTTIAQMLKDVRYTTGMFGKWHLGDTKMNRPYQRGFDEVRQHGAGDLGFFRLNCLEGCFKAKFVFSMLYQRLSMTTPIA